MRMRVTAAVLLAVLLAIAACLWLLVAVTATMLDGLESHEGVDPYTEDACPAEWKWHNLTMFKELASFSVFPLAPRRAAWIDSPGLMVWPKSLARLILRNHSSDTCLMGSKHSQLASSVCPVKNSASDRTQWRWSGLELLELLLALSPLIALPMVWLMRQVFLFNNRNCEENRAAWSTLIPRHLSAILVCNTFTSSALLFTLHHLRGQYQESDWIAVLVFQLIFYAIGLMVLLVVAQMLRDGMRRVLYNTADPHDALFEHMHVFIAEENEGDEDEDEGDWEEDEWDVDDDDDEQDALFQMAQPWPQDGMGPHLLPVPRWLVLRWRRQRRDDDQRARPDEDIHRRLGWVCLRVGTPLRTSILCDV
ncbi:hypothetical protein PTSG_06849 [Salpingoeca rosetta]|uniref:Uncharacterized protein n=1 Tax=Salpingoeca rosetta (strain ATCC 50818 / BSB-021) TaxID=946362 RepID=F2UEZ6_SALR5|nr:uncharacterized protein PTSG_06849 [Salpingoeca rosetta]EGD75196.1 hypothetical protein PTSG_06849 [Salpingoeca rosetta]|eukprot:XP_004992249.1 hypothetical protein PTSG_06849 [Salpingoeca rosetta]